MAAVCCSRGRECFIILTSAKIKKKKDKVIESTPNIKKEERGEKKQFKQKFKSKIRMWNQKDRNSEDCFV